MSEPKPIELTRIPIRLTSQWRSKVVTTDPPRLTPHDEWHLAIDISADAPFRFVTLLLAPDEVSWGVDPRPPSEHASTAVGFKPFAWNTSDEVQITIGLRRHAVVDKELREDPRPLISVTLPATAMTGDVIRVCALPRHDLEFAVLPIAQSDTELRRDRRWCVRPALASSLPEYLSSFTAGHQAGVGSR